ncbi:MAG: ABC transporter permease [Eubacteriales bacterium]
MKDKPCKAVKILKSGAFRRAAACMLALSVWQGASMLPVGGVLIASPWDTAVRLAELVRGIAFWRSLGQTFGHIASGFLIGLALGAALAALSVKFPVVEDLLRPYVFMVKSVPVASFIVIALVWMSSKSLSVFISFLMVFPVIYSNILQGIKSSDRQLSEMAKVFRIPAGKRFLYITLPGLKSHIVSGCSTALGLAWKAGVAAEVIGIPYGTVGEQLYMAKVHFDTAELFAWTAVIVVMSIAFEKFFLAMLKLFYGRLERS